MTEFRVLELFSGIGGMHFAFKRAEVPGFVVAAVDINNVANAVYSHNHPLTPVMNTNIQRLNANKIAKLGVNMVLMSPPCQPFTRVGNKLDIDDNRTDALKHICTLMPQCDGIEYVLMENVKGFETSRARDHYVETLKTCGFYVREFILSPTQFGVPNTRHRYYCLARRKRDFNFGNINKIEETWIVKQLPKQVHSIRQILQHEDEISSDSYLQYNVLRKRVGLLDIVGPDALNTNCFTKAYTHYSEGTGSVLTSLNSDELKETFDRLKQLRLENAQDLELLWSLRLRYFTPCEVARLMSFPESFSFPQETSTRQKYRLLGNSINVLVVSELIKLLCSDI